jgi:hypothetical protein
LAVSPANSDLANSDALQMARQADPDGMYQCMYVQNPNECMPLLAATVIK